MKNMLFTGLFLLLAIILGAQTEPEWLWAVQTGGNNSDSGFDAVTDGNDNVYVTGFFSGTVSFGSQTLTSHGEADIFIAKVDPSGNYLWTKNAGGPSSDWGNAITLDGSGNVCVTGYFAATAVFGTTTLTSLGLQDTFVAKLDELGNWILAVRGGGSGNDYALGISGDGIGNLYIVGEFQNTVVFGATTLVCDGNLDAYVAKLDSGGNWLWAKRAGGPSYDYGKSITADPWGYITVVGNFSGTAGFGDISLTSTGGSSDIYVAHLDADGNWLWAVRAGGTGSDVAWGIAQEPWGNYYICGEFTDTAPFGTYSISSQGNSDAFIATLDMQGNFLWAQSSGGSGWEVAWDVKTNSERRCCVCGYFQSDALFGTTVLYSAGWKDIFAGVLDPQGSWVVAQRAGGSDEDEAYGIVPDSAGDCILTGYFGQTAEFVPFYLTSSGQEDIFVAKLHSGNVENTDPLAPSSSAGSRLYAAYPNPVRTGGVIQIKVTVASRESGTLGIYNLRGQRMASFSLDPGSRQLSLATGSLASGIYICQLRTPSTSELIKLVVLN